MNAAKLGEEAYDIVSDVMNIEGDSNMPNQKQKEQIGKRILQLFLGEPYDDATH